MKTLILILVFGSSLKAGAADCRSTMEGLLSAQGLSSPSSGVRHSDFEMDSKKILERRQYYMNHAIYTYKKDPKYGDIFNLGDDVDGFIDGNKHFTVIHKHTKGSVEMRVFENQKEGKIQGFSHEQNKRLGIYYFNSDCSISEGVVIHEGARCYLKKSECADLIPVTAAKLQKKCSYFGDFSEKSISSFTSACSFMTAPSRQEHTEKTPTAERKDKASAVR